MGFEDLSLDDLLSLFEDGGQGMLDLSGIDIGDPAGWATGLGGGDVPDLTFASFVGDLPENPTNGTDPFWGAGTGDYDAPAVDPYDPYAPDLGSAKGSNASGLARLLQQGGGGLAKLLGSAAKGLLGGGDDGGGLASLSLGGGGGGSIIPQGLPGTFAPDALTPGAIGMGAAINPGLSIPGMSLPAINAGGGMPGAISEGSIPALAGGGMPLPGLGSLTANPSLALSAQGGGPGPAPLGVSPFTPIASNVAMPQVPGGVPRNQLPGLQRLLMEG